MKKCRLCMIVFLFVLTLSEACFSMAVPAAETESEAGSDEVAVVILHTNDSHCALEKNIGFDGLALYRKELEEMYDNVLLVDCGDAIQGAPIGAISEGKEIIRVMNFVGYDVATLGNHEFDFGFDVLNECAQELECGYICANFCMADGTPVFSPWKILEAGDVKIGFIGVVTPDTYTKSIIKNILNESGQPMYDFLADESGDKLCGALQQSVDEVREAGADYVILLSHLGNNSSVTPQFRTAAVLAKLSGVDAVLDGHSHEIYNVTMPDKEGKEIPVVQTGSEFREIGQMIIYKDGHVENMLFDEVPEPEGLEYEKVARGSVERYADAGMKQFMEEIFASYADEMERKIGKASYDLIVRDQDGKDVSRDHENALCELVADAFRDTCDTQAAFTIAGSVRNNLPAGDITYNSILNVLPYSNEVVTVSVSGRTLRDALEYGVSALPEKTSGFPQVSGITFALDAGKPSSVRFDENHQFVSVDGEYRVSDIMGGGEPLDLEAEYTVAMTRYILDGGDGFTMFKEADLINNTMTPDNEMLIYYIENTLGGNIPDDYRTVQGRIHMTDDTALSRAA